MSIPRPKFCVGEVVNLVTTGGIKFNDGYEVISAEYFIRGEMDKYGDINRKNHWAYEVSPDPVPSYTSYWGEKNLIKRKEDDNWQPLIDIWNPVKETV